MTRVLSTLAVLEQRVRRRVSTLATRVSVLPVYMVTIVRLAENSVIQEHVQVEETVSTQGQV